MPEPIISAEMNQHFEAISSTLELIAEATNVEDEEKHVTALLAQIDSLGAHVIHRRDTEMRNTKAEKIRSALRTSLELAFAEKTRKILEVLDSDSYGPHGPGCTCPRVMH